MFLRYPGTRAGISGVINTIACKGVSLGAAVLWFGCILAAQHVRGQAASPAPLTVGKRGALQYHPDERGDRIPDFSFAGYMAGNDSIPDVPARVAVPHQDGDQTASIQDALDYVAGLPVGPGGFRGAVLLSPGVYHLSGRLKMRASGVVLRGSGMGKGGTTLVADGLGRATLIRVYGTHDLSVGKAVAVTDAYVPVGAATLHVADPGRFKPGDSVIVTRPCTQAWIEKLGMVDFGGQSGWLGWKPGDEDIHWDRKVVSVNGDELTLDVPITTALDSTYGGGTVAVYHWPGRISRVGIENLRLSSAYDTANPKDESHCWMAITLENVEDAWVRQVVFSHFAGSAVYAINTSRRITVEDCKSLDPVSEIGGWRRYTFCTDGQQTLFQRLYSDRGYHDFAVGFCAAGPNVFVQCKAHLPYSYSGAIDSWSSGTLFDGVRSDGGALSFRNLGQDNHGAGWSAANSMFWQCDASLISCYKPPTAQNWAFGCWSEPAGHGYWNQPNEHINPQSLYYAQLAQRLGRSMAHRSQLMEILSDPTSSPTPAQAAALIALAEKPGPLLTDWIDSAAEREPIPVNPEGVKTLRQTGFRPVASKPVEAPKMRIVNGWLVRGDKVLTGTRYEVPWWRGDVQPGDTAAAAPAVTRFVPGRVGNGLTDDLEAETDGMRTHHVIALEQNYGLWYDRRRDDHERVRRMTGDVWPPFYELPFARSGKGTAWDGLSQYDLTRYNPWYWSRLKHFADLADQKGLVLIHKNYFQHNIIEAGAHWVDFPWRTANNINQTGFPEPPPFAGDKRIFMARQFYDTANAVRRKLHIAFIDKCLDNFKGNTGVIQLTAAEFTGPLHFMQFWLDVIGRWEKQTHVKEFIGLSATKDVQDAILRDPRRASLVDVIDIRQWHYEKDSSLYAPKGGLNLAPRQLARLYRPKGSSFSQVYRAVREYRDRYPGKAVVYSAGRYDAFAWAAFMAGGSLAAIPAVSDPRFLTEASGTKPADTKNAAPGVYLLSDPGKAYILYLDGASQATLDLSGVDGRLVVRRLDPRTGKMAPGTESIRGGKTVTLQSDHHPEVLWISRR